MDALGFVVFLVVVVLVVRWALGQVNSNAESSQPAQRAAGQSVPPPHKKVASQAEWIPPGQLVQVGGFHIPGGMIYVGTRLPSLRHQQTPEPALINPALQVAQRGSVGAGGDMGYWPSYSSITATARAGYLKWLSGGRRDLNASVGYVFLFFYGIERRVLHDAQHSEQAKREIPALLAEVKGLLDVYGPQSRSIRGYLSRFIEVVRLGQGIPEGEGDRPPMERESYELPMAVQVGVGKFIKAGQPIPSEWALSWLRCHPELPLRTPAERCASEFNTLFQIRYREKYGEGMRLPSGSSKLKVVYKPASASFADAVTARVGDLPDISRLTAPARRLHDLGVAVQDELDAYSRWLGKSNNPSSAAALALLPRELVSDRMGEETRALTALIDSRLDADGIALVPTTDLLARFPSKDPAKLSKKERCLLGDFLATLGYGIEPDARFDGPNLLSSKNAAIFKLTDGDAAPSPAFAAASALLHLGAAVVTADDQVTAEEERHLEQHLEDALHLPLSDRRRLRAHTKWLLADPPVLRVLKNQVEVLPESLRHSLGQYLITIAGADGHVSAHELKLLSKIYPILGLDLNDVYRDVHAIAAAGPTIATTPVTVVEADQEYVGFKIPKPAAPKPEPDVSVFVLDTAKVAQIRLQSKHAAEVLGGIFAGEEAEATAEEQGDVAVEVVEAEDTIGGLDAAHSALFKQVACRDSIGRAEFAALAEQAGLLAGGAAEVINDAAFEACGEPLLEGNDPIEVNQYAAQEMLA